MTVLVANASRIRSGGGLLHLLKFIDYFDQYSRTFDTLIVFAPKNILHLLPNSSSIRYLSPPFEQSLIFVLFWEFLILPRFLSNLGPHVLLNLDAGSLCVSKPCVTISQDMLPFENEHLTYFPSTGWLRLIVLKFIQRYSLTHSSHSVFLTRYAHVILKNNSTHKSNSSIIPHGVDVYHSINDQQPKQRNS